MWGIAIGHGKGGWVDQTGSGIGKPHVRRSLERKELGSCTERERSM